MARSLRVVRSRQRPQKTEPYFLVLLFEGGGSCTVHLGEITKDEARKEAREYLADLRQGAGRVELYRRGRGPLGASLLVWVGFA
jgi:hypothetical protein